MAIHSSHRLQICRTAHGLAVLLPTEEVLDGLTYIDALLISIAEEYHSESIGKRCRIRADVLDWIADTLQTYQFEPGALLCRSQAQLCRGSKIPRLAAE
jgi:hypothetical protein